MPRHETRQFVSHWLHSASTKVPPRGPSRNSPRGSSSAKGYPYCKLDRSAKEIRLLILEPGTGIDIIRCTLQHEDLDASPPPLYETVSYVCGDPNERAMIRLHGIRVEILATSQAALRHIRFKYKPRTLWIDSICIDKDNAKELGHQVDMLYEIYTRTSYNLVYLGPDDFDMPRVWQSMDAMCREILSETRDSVDLKKTLFGPTGQTKHSDAPFSIDIQQSGLVQFYENEWFTRLWVVQEAALSRISTCYIGQYRLPLKCVLRIAAWPRYKRAKLPGMSRIQHTGLTNAAIMFDLTDTDHGRTVSMDNTLWMLLRSCGSFRTLKRNDRVFAVMALWRKQTNAKFLPPDLKRNHTPKVHEVFTNACKFAIQESRNLTLL